MGGLDGQGKLGEVLPIGSTCALVLGCFCGPLCSSVLHGALNASWCSLGSLEGPVWVLLEFALGCSCFLVPCTVSGNSEGPCWVYESLGPALLLS